MSRSDCSESIPRNANCGACTLTDAHGASSVDATPVPEEEGAPRAAKDGAPRGSPGDPLGQGSSTVPTMLRPRQGGRPGAFDDGSARRSRGGAHDSPCVCAALVLARAAERHGH